QGSGASQWLRSLTSIHLVSANLEPALCSSATREYDVELQDTIHDRNSFCGMGCFLRHIAQNQPQEATARRSVAPVQLHRYRCKNNIHPPAEEGLRRFRPCLRQSQAHSCREYPGAAEARTNTCCVRTGDCPRFAPDQ